MNTKRLRFVLSVVGLSALAATVFAAESGTTNKQPAEASAKNWLSLVDAGKYDESWDASGSFFRSKITKADWKKSLTAVRPPLGSMTSRKMEASQAIKNAPGAPAGEYVVIQYKTVFQNKKDAVETVTEMLDKDAKWRMAGYFIR